MPVLSWGHSHYWSGAQGGDPPESPTPSMGGYPAWQAGLLYHGSLFGGLQPVWQWIVTVRISKEKG